MILFNNIGTYNNITIFSHNHSIIAWVLIDVVNSSIAWDEKGLEYTPTRTSGENRSPPHNTLIHRFNIITYYALYHKN